MDTNNLIKSTAVILHPDDADPITAEVQFGNGKKAYISVYLNMENTTDYPSGLATVIIHNVSGNINIQTPGFDDLT